MATYVITADSTPDYDVWGPDEYWGAGEWISWHKALTARWGIEEANRRFLAAYHAAGFGAASYDLRTFDPAFRTYARDAGFYEGLFPGLSVVPRLLGSVFDLFRGAAKVGESGEAVGSGINRGLTFASNVIIPLALLAAVVFVSFKLYRSLKTN